MMNMLGVFQSFRRILCFCPHCGEILRLSDLHLKYTGKVPKTWLDEYESKVRRVQKKEEKFDEKEQKLRENAIERGRKKVPILIKKCIYPGLAKLRYDPYDIKAIMHPVDFIVFNGLNEGTEVRDVTFLSKKSSDRKLNLILKSVRKTVDKGNYDWKVARVTTDGNVNFE